MSRYGTATIRYLPYVLYHHQYVLILNVLDSGSHGSTLYGLLEPDTNQVGRTEVMNKKKEKNDFLMS
jgi:hypothetical protein